MSQLMSRSISRQNTFTGLQRSWSSLIKSMVPVFRILIHVSTTPWEYLRTPIANILQMREPQSQNEAIEIWCGNKGSEYRYVAIAGTVVATAVTASFSWDGLNANATWLTLGTWYGSIIFSLVSVIIAFHYTILFANFRIIPKWHPNVLRAISRKSKPDCIDLVFFYALQVPGMFLSFSLMSYFMGLSTLVLSPLWEQEWGPGTKSAIVYLAYLVFAGLNYFLVCIMMYSKCIPMRQ